MVSSELLSFISIVVSIIMSILLFFGKLVIDERTKRIDRLDQEFAAYKQRVQKTEIDVASIGECLTGTFNLLKQSIDALTRQVEHNNELLTKSMEKLEAKIENRIYTWNNKEREK